MTAARWTAAYLAAGVLGVLLILAHLFVGRSEVPPAEIVRVLTGRPTERAYEVIVLSYRLPRVLVGLAAGALLAVSGVLAQAVVRNPLAEPSTTGVGAGAALGVVASALVWPGHTHTTWAALTGALATGLTLYAVGRGALAVVGVLLGAVLSAATSLLLVADSAPMSTVLRWLVGSLNARTPDDWAAVWPWLALVPVAWTITPALNAWALGEPVAAGLGLRVRVVVASALLLSVTCGAAAIAAAGAVAFVGLAAPHLARRLVGGDHRLLLPVSACLGALLLSAADLVAFSVSVQIPGVPPDVTGVPVGAVTALLGAPFLVVLTRRELRR